MNAGRSDSAHLSPRLVALGNEPLNLVGGFASETRAIGSMRYPQALDDVIGSGHFFLPQLDFICEYALSLTVVFDFGRDVPAALRLLML